MISFIKTANTSGRASVSTSLKEAGGVRGDVREIGEMTRREKSRSKTIPIRREESRGTKDKQDEADRKTRYTFKKRMGKEAVEQGRSSRFSLSVLVRLRHTSFCT